MKGRHVSKTDFASQEELLTITAALLYSARFLLDGPPAREALDHFCADLTQRVPNIVLAWTWFGDAGTDEIRPQVAAGVAKDYAATLEIRRTMLTSVGPAFRALRGEHVPPFAVSPNSPFSPWRDASRQYGIRSVMALPLESSVDSQRGILVLYARVEDYFERVGVEAFRSMAGLFGAVLSRSARIEALQRAATRDKLTGLLNRNAEPLLREKLRRAGEESPPSAALICDIDRFKSVNDTHGHDAGDAVIAGFARLISGRVRSTDIALRWGGEEFVVGLPGASREVALGVAEDIRERVAQEAIDIGGGRTLRVTCSIGLAALQPGEDLSDALRRADEALYQAKNGGRDRVVAAG